MGESKPVQNNTKEWVKENEKFFLPPVCNKMMHNDQLKVFFVGGPNQRKDFHLEEGEELFFMRKGNMSLPILTNGNFRTIHIKEGDIFLLPGKIPHSPQREKDTVGLVIERERLPTETDGLRYFVDGTTDILFERWFYCDDLGTQLKPIIDEFFASDECKNGVPGPDSVNKNPPWNPDSKRVVESPFNLQEWLDAHRRLIRSSGSQPLFSPSSYQSNVLVMGLGQGSRTIASPSETLLWQLEGSAMITVGSEDFRLRRDETILIPGGQHFMYCPSTEALTLSTVMDPANKNRPGDN
eukprot:GFUD01027780.1.p1 GENE.GFUD01027780.1~~GFUD01027780.1.p1  ORF type:complete len:296 (-),score=86.37 GFUD01027780.1:152-1039(-)